MDNKTLVLFSGGWESVYCLIKAINLYGNDNITAMYFQYGADHQTPEYSAAQAICRVLKVKMDTIDVGSTLPAKDGVFKGRNTVFLTECIRKYPSVERVYFGCRNVFMFMDRYGDSNWEYAKIMSKALSIDVVTPCIMLPKKFEVYFVSKHLNDAENMIYSTE